MQTHKAPQPQSVTLQDSTKDQIGLESHKTFLPKGNKLFPLRNLLTINKTYHILTNYLSINDSKTPKNNNTTIPNSATHTQRGFLF